jgi:hypothetical protein
VIPEKSYSYPNAMLVETQFDIPSPVGYYLREPSEPSPPPIREPPSPPENPEAPVREPDPDAPDEI